MPWAVEKLPTNRSSPAGPRTMPRGTYGALWSLWAMTGPREAPVLFVEGQNFARQVRVHVLVDDDQAVAINDHSIRSEQAAGSKPGIQRAGGDIKPFDEVVSGVADVQDIGAGRLR